MRCGARKWKEDAPLPQLQESSTRGPGAIHPPTALPRAVFPFVRRAIRFFRPRRTLASRTWLLAAPKNPFASRTCLQAGVENCPASRTSLQTGAQNCPASRTWLLAAVKNRIASRTCLLAGSKNRPAPRTWVLTAGKKSIATRSLRVPGVSLRTPAVTEQASFFARPV